jgi:transposase-like protein
LAVPEEEDGRAVAEVDGPAAEAEVSVDSEAAAVVAAVREDHGKTKTLKRKFQGFCAIRTIYPKTDVQTCVVHQIRNSIKYIASKDQRTFMNELKPVYRAVSEPQAQDELAKLKVKCEKKYPMVIGSWERNWSKLSTYFKYPANIRRLIFTTNTIEGYHRQIRKVTKNKGVFNSDMALLKLIYLATERISQKWTMPLQSWGATATQLKIIFAERMKMDL